jgi:5-methylcytosine-specific restriction protein A
MPCNQIKTSLEEMFSIPFIVNQVVGLGKLEFNVTPADVEKDEAFAVRISFQNNLRVIVEFIPGRFCVNMIRKMGHACEEKKKVFDSYATSMLRQNAQCRFFINKSEANLLDYAGWPMEWANLELRVTRSPIISDDNESIDYLGTAVLWGGFVLGMLLSLLDIVPTEENPVTGYKEGKMAIIKMKRYERNPLNRTACILAKGMRCWVCDMDFQSIYGQIGLGYIHVHHIIPVSKMGEGYLVDPVNDLVPVCPNCHVMLHRTDPPLEIGTLKEIYISNKVTK